MESDTERSIILRDSDKIVGGENAQRSNVSAALNSGGSSVKINSLSIDLGIVKEKGDDAQICSHFSIRGYAAKMRERGGNNYLPFGDGSGVQELPPMEVPCFRYWLCQRCLQDCGGGNTSQEVALVSQYGKSKFQPCTSSYSTLDCHRLPILPFGEGTSGLKPVDKRNDTENILTVLQEDTTQPSPNNHTDIVEPAKIDSVATNVTAEATAVEDNHLQDIDDFNNVHSDQQNDDPSGNPRRKARKVRLLAELLCGSTKEKHQRKESNLLDSCPNQSSSQIKRKLPQAQDRRSIDVTGQCQSHVGKKVKVFKGDAAMKTSIVEHSRDQITDKYQCKKHGSQKSSKLGKVSSDPVAAWRSIFSDMGRSDKLNSVAIGTSGTDSFSKLMTPPQPEKKSIISKKILENPLRNHQFFGEDMQMENFGGSRMRDRQSDTGLGLGLSLHYDPNSHVSSLPPIGNRVSIQDHSRKPGFYFGESSFTHRGITSDPQVKARSIYEARDGHIPRTATLQDQQNYHAHLLHGSFSQHQNLDFSDPHSKRNSGVRAYSDAMRTHNHQRQEIFTNGRSDEKEIVELMAKIQHERNLSEARSYNNNRISSTSSFHKVNFNEGMPLPLHQYPTMRTPSSSMMPTLQKTGPTIMRNPAGFFHQDQVPPFTSFDSFSEGRKQPSSNGIRITDHGQQMLHSNSNYYESKGNHYNNYNYNNYNNYNYNNNNKSNKMAQQSAPTNTQIMEEFNKYRDGSETPGNVWSNMEMHTKWSNRNKGKNIMNLDLNVSAPNVSEEQNHLGSLDSSYSNEAIPAMQLLSLMDAGKSSSPFTMDGKKFTPKPFSSCYNHGKPNSIDSCHNSYSGLQSGVQKPIENSRNLNLGHGTCSPSSAVTNSFSSYFEGRQFYHNKPPQQKKPKVMSSASEDSFVFPVSWHATEERSERVGPRNLNLGTEVCTINQNPADFTSPGPDNVYMINFDDLKIRGEGCYKTKFASENAGGQNWQKRS